MLTALLKSTPTLDTLVHHLWSRGRIIRILPPTPTVVETITLLNPMTVMRASKFVLTSCHDDLMKATYGSAMPCLGWTAKRTLMGRHLEPRSSRPATIALITQTRRYVVRIFVCKVHEFTTSYICF